MATTSASESSAKTGLGIAAGDFHQPAAASVISSNHSHRHPISPQNAIVTAAGRDSKCQRQFLEYSMSQCPQPTDIIVPSVPTTTAVDTAQRHHPQTPEPTTSNHGHTKHHYHPYKQRTQQTFIRRNIRHIPESLPEARASNDSSCITHSISSIINGR